MKELIDTLAVHAGYLERYRSGDQRAMAGDIRDAIAALEAAEAENEANERNLEILTTSLVVAVRDIEKLRAQVAELEVMVPKWVPVTHDLPGKHGVYIVSDGERTSYCTFWYDKGVWGGAGITHWMPLPAAPKEEV